MGSKQVLRSVQALRWIAASLVVIMHVNGQIWDRIGEPGLPWSAISPTFGGVGVDLFFVISGFIMVYTTPNDSGGSGKFLMRRLIRILPMYWFYTTVILLLLVFAPQAFARLELQVWHAVASYMLIPAANSGGLITPLLNVGWTLTYEMYFYLIFAAVLMASFVARLPLLVIVLGACVGIGVVFQPADPIGQTLTSPLLLHFLLGAGAAQLALSRLPVAFAIIATVAGLAGYAYAFTSAPPEDLFLRVLVWGAPAALLVFGLSRLELSGALVVPDFLARLGDSSYSLYLSHVILIAGLGKIIDVLNLSPDGAPVVVMLVAGYLAALAGGILSYECLERPATKALKAWAGQDRRRRAPA